MKTHHLEHDDTIRCFHCGNIVPMKLIGRDVSTWDEGEPYIGVEEWSFYMCPTCKAPTLICYYWQQNDKEITSPIGRSVVYPDNLFDDRSIPENIRKAYMAAAATKSLDNSVSLLAWRRVLELTCKDLGANGKSLYDQISDLSNRNVLPVSLKDASNLIRSLGNAGAHSDELSDKWMNLADIESLVKYILEYAYVLPQKINSITASTNNNG